MTTNDPVSEAIEKEMNAHNTNSFMVSSTHDALWTGEDVRNALHRIASLSYARGVEDSANLAKSMFSVFPSGGIHDFYEDEELISKENTVAAIRSLIPNEKKV